MPERRVIVNTSPLFYLHQIDRLDLLPALYGRVTVPNAVWRELQAGQTQGLNIPSVDQLSWASLAAGQLFT